ncbi:apelin receptor A-like [Paramormyrops kingsleyae]|uniref:apelin receptor A-like n=1 Tax=Paramormyrops kingsleyae TaxID=1676925 RepID=UPI000CD627EB|nr:apelin receptor A-like [Paramormyrops kingsleyae]XP_023657374.1 apelin receptor A-like [Paramormyrops kingsleyae]XP_023657375.1 apelin receptor A-like [Paramormyrops kingsleyae]
MENKTSPTTHSYSGPPLAAIFLVIFILGLFGNGLVIIIISKFKSKQGGANSYIRHLASADLLFMLTLPLWATEAFLHDHWPFGWFLCKVSSSIVQLSMYASIFLLTYMSFDRYFAIVRRVPSSQRYSQKTMLVSLGSIWLLSFLLTTPTALFCTTETTPENHTYCNMNFSLVVSAPEKEIGWNVGLNILRTVVGFLVPCLSMSICYCFIGRALNHHFSAVHQEEQRRRRLLKTISILVVVFSLCWAPFHVATTIYSLIRLHLMSTKTNILVQLAFPYTICLAFANSCLNPFLYAFFDLQFRTHCLQLLHLRKGTTDPAKIHSSQTQSSEQCTVATTV